MKIYYQNCKEWRKEYLKRNKEKIKEQIKIWCQNNKKKHKEQRKKYRKRNKEKIKKRDKIYQQRNKEKAKELHKKYYQHHKEKIKKRSKRYAQNNKEKINRISRIYAKHRLLNDAIYKIRKNLRSRLWKAIKESGGKKHARTMELVGCSIEFVKEHLESQFDSKMNWNNYGSYFHIDHRIPCASFDLTNSEEQKKCFHWSNLQPLEGKENMSKGAKILPQYLNQKAA